MVENEVVHDMIMSVVSSVVALFLLRFWKEMAKLGVEKVRFMKQIGNCYLVVGNFYIFCQYLIGRIAMSCSGLWLGILVFGIDIFPYHLIDLFMGFAPNNLGIDFTNKISVGF